MFTMLVSIFTWVAFLWIWFLSSAAVSIFIFLNSRKNKMNTLLWTAVSFIFNVFGLCAYFIIREKKNRETCPVCGAKTEEWETFCPVCDVKLESVRPKMKLVTKLFIGICVTAAVIAVLSQIFNAIVSA